MYSHFFCSASSTLLPFFAIFSQTSLLSSAPLSPADTMPLALEADNNIGVGQLARHPGSSPPRRGDCVRARFEERGEVQQQQQQALLLSSLLLSSRRFIFSGRSPIFIISRPLVSHLASPFFSFFPPPLRLFLRLSRSVRFLGSSRASSRASDAVSCLVCGTKAGSHRHGGFSNDSLYTRRVHRLCLTAFYLAVVHHDRNRGHTLDTHSFFQVHAL